MKHYLTRFHRLWLVLGVLTVDGLFFGLTDPQRLPAYMVIVAFLLVVVNVYMLVRGLLLALSWYGVPLKHERRRLARLTTLILASLLALQSIGQLSARDLAVLLPFALLAYGYVSYGKARPENG